MEALGQSKAYQGLIQTEISQVPGNSDLYNLKCNLFSIWKLDMLMIFWGSRERFSRRACVYLKWKRTFKKHHTGDGNTSSSGVRLVYYLVRKLKFIEFLLCLLSLLFAEAPGDGDDWQAENCRTERGNSQVFQYKHQTWQSKHRSSRPIVLTTHTHQGHNSFTLFLLT